MVKGSKESISAWEGASLSISGRRYRLGYPRRVTGLTDPRTADDERRAKSGMAEAAVGNRMDPSVPLRSSNDRSSNDRSNNENDVAQAPREGRTMSGRLGLSATEATLVTTAFSGLARKIIDYAGHREIHRNPATRRGTKAR